jgi:hypothetical protein
MRSRYMLPLVCMLFIAASARAGTRVRTVAIKKDQIVTVNTALGIATIIQVPDKPNSVVLGDMSAYKVEYLDTAITIKPLSAHARSNLYIYTDYRRFCVQLITGAGPSSDYVVYLENPKSKEPTKMLLNGNARITWKKIARSGRNRDLNLQINKIGRDARGSVLIDFTLKCEKEEAVHPGWFWLTQEGKSHPIQGLTLSSLHVSKKTPVHGTIEILRSDLDEMAELHVELRRKQVTTFRIGVNEWKH